jgi:transcriptional regulator of acetoin/glycerol metabolism
MEKWRSYQRELPYSNPARYAIIESWKRSEEAGLERDAPPRFRRVTDLQERLAMCAALVDVARPRLSELLAPSPARSTSAAASAMRSPSDWLPS